jgi:osmotically-inducible protein OsmY
VTLTGTAAWHFQRAEAEMIRSSMLGLVGINNEIRLTQARSEADIQQAISCAFRRNARLDMYDLSVDARGETVILPGTPPSWSEHDDAVATAWSAPRVTDIDGWIAVTY